MSSETPKYLYKIVHRAPEDPIPKEFPLSELDKNDGFVHLSTAVQVPATAALFFDKATSLFVIKLRSAEFSDPIKWEGGFPHLYGNFGGDHVESVEKFEKSGSQKWGDILEFTSWLE